MTEDIRNLPSVRETRPIVLSPEERVWNNISRLGVANKLMASSGPNINMQRAILSGAPVSVKAAASYDSVSFVTELGAKFTGLYVRPKLIATQGPLKNRQSLSVSLYKIADSEEDQKTLARAIWGDITDEEKIQLALSGIQKLKDYEKGSMDYPDAEPDIVQDHKGRLENLIRIEEAMKEGDIQISFDPQYAAVRISANSK